MQTLFATMDPVVPAIEGLRYIPNFLTASDHNRLLTLIDAAPWNTNWKRRVQPYGGAYGSSSSAPMPLWAKELAERLHNMYLTPFICDHMLVNEYLPGQGIAPHADYDLYDRTVVSISLGSHCMMDLERLDGTEKHGLWLEPRSVLIMDGEARYQWRHGIAARKKDSWNGTWFKRGRRVSITFRKKKRYEPHSSILFE